MARKAAGKKANVLQLLKQDHDYVKKAFRQFEKMDHAKLPAVQALADTVCEALEIHTRIEEEIFYPPARKALKDDDLMNEAKIEHESAKALIKRVRSMKAGDPEFVAAFTVLGEYVAHHVQEEESEMFPKVRRRGLNLDALGKKLMARKIALGK